MPKKEIISTDKVTAGNAPLSQGVRYGNLVFVQGCTGRHPTDNTVGADIKEQTPLRPPAHLHHSGGLRFVAGPGPYQHLLCEPTGKTCPASTRSTPNFSQPTGLPVPLSS